MGYDGLVSDDKREFWTDSRCFLVYLEDFGPFGERDRLNVAKQKFSEVLKMLGLSDEKIDHSLKSVGFLWM